MRIFRPHRAYDSQIWMSRGMMSLFFNARTHTQKKSPGVDSRIQKRLPTLRGLYRCLCSEHADGIQRDDPEEDREHGADGADRQHFPGELAVAAHALAHREEGVRKRGCVQREQDEELDAAEAEHIADRRDDRRQDDELQHSADRDDLYVLSDVRQHQRRAADEDRKRRVI